MSNSKTSHSRSLNDNLKYDTSKSKESLSNTFIEEKPPCPCNSIDQQETLDGFTMSLKSMNSSSHSINEGDKKFKEDPIVTNKEASRHEVATNIDKPREEDVSSNITAIELSRMLKEPDDDYKSVSDMITFVDCGEPMPAQYLRLDFSQMKRVDNDEFRLKKCVDFWKLIKEHPELKTLKVEAEPYDFGEYDSFVSLSETPPCSVSTISPEGMSLTPITLQALNWLEKENLMTESLVTKTAGRLICEPGCKDYLEYRNKRPDNWPEIRKDIRQDLMPITSSMSLSKVQKSVTNLDVKAQPLDDVVQMMAEMHKWDLEHPKSMDPPVHEKRKRRIVPHIEKNDELLCEKCLH